MSLVIFIFKVKTESDCHSENITGSLKLDPTKSSRPRTVWSSGVRQLITNKPVHSHSAPSSGLPPTRGVEWLITELLFLRWTIALRGYDAASPRVLLTRRELQAKAEQNEWERLTSLKDLNRLRVFSRSLSTHSFLLCSSSFFFSRFCRQQRETLRGTGEKQRLSFAAPTTWLTYEVDLVMLAEDYGALFFRQVLLLMCIRALILKRDKTYHLIARKYILVCQKLATVWANG